MNKIWKKIFKYFKKQKCSFCKKTKSKLYDIPVYSDIHSIVCSMTFESYLTCGKCLRNLLEKHILVISLKCLIKQSVISDINKDLSVSSHNKINQLQEILRKETEFHNYTNYLFEEDDRAIKTVINKVNTYCMC